jgi:hypothetical protein
MNIEHLAVSYLDSNERVIELTSLRYLTSLLVSETLQVSTFDGRYLTVLTSLRSLCVYGGELVSEISRRKCRI